MIYAIALKSYCILTVNRTKGLLRIRGSKDRRLCPHPHLPALTTRTLHRPRTRHPGHKANRALSPFPSASVKVTRQFACVAVNARLNAIAVLHAWPMLPSKASNDETGVAQIACVEDTSTTANQMPCPCCVCHSKPSSQMIKPNVSTIIWSVADLLRGNSKQSECSKVHRHVYVFKPPHLLAKTDTELSGVTDRVLSMIGGLSA